MKRGTDCKPVFQFIPMTEEHGREICRWRYEPPYDLYNWEDWDVMQAEGQEFADSALRAAQYASVLDGKNRLIGFIQFFPLEGDPIGTTRLGLGLRPDLCGLQSGIGVAFLRACTEEALRRDPRKAVDLEVLTWNLRAIKTYERSGFRVVDRYVRMTPAGEMDFLCMEYEGSPQSGPI